MSDSTNELKACIGLIRDSDLITEDQKEFKRLLELSACRLQNAIRIGLDLLNISAGQIKISISETNIHDLLGQVYQEFQPLAEKTGIHFTVKFPGLDPAIVIQTDPEILSMIFINLIGPAFDHLNTDPIEFGCLSDDNPLEFLVSDTGYALSYLDRELEGHGFIGRYRPNAINLIALENAQSPVKLLVQMLGGTIRVVKNPDKGSTVFFTVSDSLINDDEISVDESEPKENGLIDSGDHVEQYDHWIRNVLYILSHEIRTPNNGIMGFAYLCSSSIDVSPGQQQYFKLIRDTATHINQIFSNCLEPYLLPRR